MTPDDAFHVYDTTLRDGAQQEGLSLTVADKLAIARRLVAMHGGQLELSSRVGHGSRFTFKLKAFAEEVD